MIYVSKSASDIQVSGRPLALTHNIGLLCWNISEKNKLAEIKVSISDCVTVSLISTKKWSIISKNKDLQSIFNGLIQQGEQNQTKSKLPRSTISYDGDITLSIGREDASTLSSDDGSKVKCTICRQKIVKKCMRLHIGKHILKSEVDVHWCGYCGSIGCTISLKKTSHNTLIPTSNCVNFVKFLLKADESVKERNPCSNRPERCDVCKEIYWSYAMEKHYGEKHSDVCCPIQISKNEKSCKKVIS